MMINAIIDINRHTSQEKDEREKHCFFHSIKIIISFESICYGRQ